MATNQTARYVRLLLSLCELQATGKPIKKGDLSKKACKKGETWGEYQKSLEDLLSKGAIAEVKKGSAVSYEPSDAKLKSLLADAVRDPKFAFEGVLGASKVNVLLELLREVPTAAPVAQAKASNGKNGTSIASYDAFKSEALEVFEQLDKDYKLDNLVPIYRIRRTMGDRVNRSQFDEWLSEMQANDVVQLIGGEMPELTPDKAQDSIKTALGGVRYYVKRL